jgi:hypothetical protein
MTPERGHAEVVLLREERSFLGERVVREAEPRRRDVRLVAVLLEGRPLQDLRPLQPVAVPGREIVVDAEHGFRLA